ncbi:MAG TPA: ATP-binding protein [Saprospiraceae bacterium]|nr:ATP-binding protein [Saprospiraceae bacterium]
MLRIIILFVLFYFIRVLNAQTLRVESIGIREGLSQGFVPDLLQDKEGFIWAGTKNGLNRYDGHSFLCFTHDPEIPHSISDDQIWVIRERGDFLIVATSIGVIDFFHKQTRRFYHLPIKGGAIPNAPFTQYIFLDAREHIWLVSGEIRGRRQICYIPLPEGFWDNVATNPGLIDSLKPQFIQTESVHSATMSRDLNTLFFNTGISGFAIDTRSLQIRPLDWPSATRPISMHLAADGKIWMLNGKAGTCFDGHSYVDLTSEVSISNFLGVTASNIALIGEKDALLAIPTEKILAAGKVSRDMAIWEIPYSQPMTCFWEDSSGNLWFGQSGTGILKANPGIRQFQHLFNGNSVYGAVFSEPNGTIHAAIPTKLLSYPEGSTSTAAQILKKTNNPVLGHWRYVTDPFGNQWLYAGADPVSRLIKTNSRGEQTAYVVPGVPSFPGNLMADADGFVWLASGKQLWQFNTQKETWKVHSLESVFSIVPEIFDLKKTSDGTLWLGTLRGLLEARPTGQDGLIFQLYTVESGALRHNAVSSLLPDTRDPRVLWLSTKGGGLSRLDIKTKQFTHIYSKNGLPNDVIYGILPDTLGNLWMSSNKGIIRYSPNTGAIRNFTEADGLQSNEFNTWAYAPGPKGTLMFGGINGLNVFSPELFSDNNHLPTVYVTELFVNNKPIGVGDSTGILAQSIEFLREIRLNFEQRNITLSFSALEFTTSVKKRFRWILEGAETQWHPETTERSATYLNLQPGTYTFKVMAANGDGLWTPHPTSLKIIIQPPWYRTIWAYLIYAVLIGGLVFGYLRFRISQWRLQQQLALEHLNAERLKDLDKFKSQVFTNVSHEFRTPLTVILGMAEQLHTQVAVPEQQSAVTLIQRSGENLLRLINQILDLAKLESNTLKINYIQGDVLAFVRYAAESMHSLASMKNILLRVDSHVPGGKIMMDYDPERLLHILHNLLSNAIKFTDSGGRITLQISLESNFQPSTELPADNYLYISVSDTGVGIPPTDLPHIFDRFFQAKNQRESGNTGSGIGLSLTNELIKAMDGHITVQSEPGKGSVFMVYLPVRQKATPESKPLSFPTPDRQPAIVQHHSGHRLQLLLIEDNPDVIEFLSICLGDHYRLDFAYNGRAGIERAIETIPDIIISDVMMPEKDGFEVCETLKNDERTSHIPLVLLTAKVGIEDRISGLRRGADAYLGKPFHPDELRAVLSNLLEMRQKLQTKYNTASEISSNVQTFVSDQEDTFLLKLRNIIEEHITVADLSVEEISRMLGMSYPVVHRKVTALTGRSLTLYVRAIRLQKAKMLLADPALSISEVAFQTGFNDPKFFSRVFSDEFGMSPSAFRTRSGA